KAISRYRFGRGSANSSRPRVFPRHQRSQEIVMTSVAPTSQRSPSQRPKKADVGMPSLSATIRVGHGKGEASRLRRTGLVPAVAYGKGLPATSISVSPKEILTILKSERGENNVIKMKVGDKSDILVMIKDYSYHPVKRDLEHVDFVEVKLDQEVMVELPLVAFGKPLGLAQGGLIRQ